MRFAQILFDFDKFRLYARSEGTALFWKKEDWEQVAADNYKSKHSWWPFRPKVFLISQMWSTLPGVFLSPCMWWIASLLLEVYHSDDGVLNRFLPHTLSLCCRDDSETLLGSGTGLQRTTGPWNCQVCPQSCRNTLEKTLWPKWFWDIKFDFNKGTGRHNTMTANVTLTEIMTNSFVTGILNVVNSASIKHYVDCGELGCSLAMKVNWKHLMELLSSPPTLPKAR